MQYVFCFSTQIYASLGIVNASRSLMCAYKADRWKEIYTEEQFAEATRAEALRMREELMGAIQK